MKTNILVLGSGGREHALVWAIARSPNVGKIFCVPGNPGIGEIAELLPLSLQDHEALANAVRTHGVGLTIVGPEAPLAAGIVDDFQAEGLTIFGPSRAASELEWSKVFAKEFMSRHRIPTAPYRTFGLEEESLAREYVSQGDPPFVIKADGLAAGKGVVVCTSREEALGVLHEFGEAKALGEAGSRIVVEGFLEGEEASVFAVTDGDRYVLLAPAQDHKREFDGDQGRNTGGMGAYAPAPCVTSEVLSRVEREILNPVLQGMKAEGRPYRGCLYLGLMLTNAGPKVIEFNARFGDPETQVVLPLYGGDLFTLLSESARGALTPETMKHSRGPFKGAAVCVVLASGGYPGKYAVGFPIAGLTASASPRGIISFHAGTSEKEGVVVTAGGRVLGVTAVEESGDLSRAIAAAYEAVPRIAFQNMHYRRDIGARALRWFK